jgi:hypothetical protein
MSKKGPIASRYEVLSNERRPFLERARDYATLTIPSVLPPQGHSNGVRLTEPYQGFGARACSHLASKLATSLYPPGHHSFELRIPAETLVENQQLAEDKSVMQGLALSRDLIVREIERKAWRRPTVAEMILLIITGNALEYLMPDNSIKVYRLDQYVVLRDPSDTVLELITLDEMSRETYGALYNRTAAEGDDLSLYTHVVLRDGMYHAGQEVNGQPVPNSQVKFPFDRVPFNALRWAMVPGESYGRGKVEEHIGDFRALEGYAKSMVDGAAMAARHIWTVSPNATGGNLRRRLATARNGDVISAAEGEITMLQFQNVGGLQVVQAQMNATIQQLSAAFLLGSDQVRDAERVTAAEIRLLAEEIEGVLGGVYTMLAQEMQASRLRVLVHQMQQQGKLPPWDETSVVPEVTTGLEALGQEQTLIKLQTAIALAQGLDPQAEYVKTDVLLTTGYNALGLPGAVRNEDEANQLRQQRAAIAAAQAAAPQVAESMAQGG